jgi:hypothetical protein
MSTWMRMFIRCAVGDADVGGVEVDADVAAVAAAAGVGDGRGGALVGVAVARAGGQEAPRRRADRPGADAEAVAELLVDQGRQDLGDLGEPGPGDPDLAAALDGLGLGQAAGWQRLAAAAAAAGAEAAAAREGHEHDREEQI